MTLKAIPGGDGIPAEPDWAKTFSDDLDLAAARAQWGLVIREMQEVGTLSVVNGHAIERLVMFRVQFDRSAREVAEAGTILKARRTAVPQLSLAWVVMKQAADMLQAAEAELGIAPVRRSKATKVVRKVKVERAADAYLRQVAK